MKFLTKYLIVISGLMIGFNATAIKLENNSGEDAKFYLRDFRFEKKSALPDIQAVKAGQTFELTKQAINEKYKDEYGEIASGPSYVYTNEDRSNKEYFKNDKTNLTPDELDSNLTITLLRNGTLKLSK